MRTLAAAAVLAYANADETSLMQDAVKRTSSAKLSASADSTSSRQDSTSKLLDTAVNMIKNGVTPDVITFVDATNQDINEEVLVAIQSEHDIDQAYINGLCQDFQTAVDALETKAETIAAHDTSRDEARATHQNCRAEEAYRCAKSRRCEEQLRQLWEHVKHEEHIMREIHDSINDEWCIHPPFFAEINVWLSHDMNWAQTSPYPLLDLPQDVRDFRGISVTHFNQYMEQKIVVERAWAVYNEKLIECSVLEEEWEDKIPDCDSAQDALREIACQHATVTRQAREEFGQEWERIMHLFDQAKIAKTANEQARKNEWETLKIVQCLLDHVHSSVITSIETGAPCPTIDSDPDGVTLAIEDCHIVTRGCGPDSMTAHLCLDWCDPPTIPPLPPVEEPACTPAYIAKEQAQFLATIQDSYMEQLTSNSDYPNDLLMEYETLLSPAGWAGCAPPKVCEDCTDSAPQPPCLEHTGGAHTCHLHEDYLSPGQSNADTFKCLDGGCIAQAGRCNGVSNCVDGSDEDGCDADTNHFVPAYLTQSYTCPTDFHDDVHFRCASGQCIEKLGLCNGISNCNDGSDEAHCSGGLQLTVEATSGRTITVETLQTHTGVFHDRDYTFDSLGHFQGKTFIKYSNDDKVTNQGKVMTKIRTHEPLTVYIVKLDAHSLPWLAGEGYTSSVFSGVSFSGVRSTRDKEWDPSLLTTDHFAASDVWSKTFPAGTISIPGNGGGDGSFLIFVDRPSTDDEEDSRLQAYWESGTCGVHGDDHNWGWCGQQVGHCPLRVTTDLCPSGTAELATFHGTGAQNSYTRDGCNYFYLAQYRCTSPVELPNFGLRLEDPPCGLSLEECRTAATNLGLGIGGAGFAFAGDYSEVGCYTYQSGQYAGMAWYGYTDAGTEVTDESALAALQLPKSRLPGTYDCTPPPSSIHCGFSEDECRSAATRQGLQIGGAGWAFSGDYSEVGCYSYQSGQYAGMAWYGYTDAGTGVTTASELPALTLPKYRIPDTFDCTPAVVEPSFIGCFVDDNNRDLGDMVGTNTDSSTNTFELCRARCGDSTYMALQFGGECFCANAYGTAAQYVQVDESECSATNEPCNSASYNCGGTWRQAIYQINR